MVKQASDAFGSDAACGPRIAPIEGKKKPHGFVNFASRYLVRADSLTFDVLV
jgi:hypothetical protein